MNRKVLVAAVAATFAAPAAFAQSSVTIGGTVNILWDNVRANNGTIQANGAVQSGNLKSADRVRDGAGSNIRFTVIEDLGGGNSAFVQVESAVIMNSDQRSDAVGNNFGVAAGTSTAIWGNRNSGIGIRSKTAGRFLIGVWDVHYHEHYSIDPGWLISNSANSTLSLTQNMGSVFGVPGGQAFGTRYSNTLRWDSPVWSGFSLAVAYARPTDQAPVNAAGSPRDGKINRAWNIAPRYESGGLSIVYSYLQDKDAVGVMAGLPAGLTAGVVPGNGALVAAGTAVFKITSSRLGGRYKFANGLGIGLLWDQGKVSFQQDNAAATGSSVKRDVWALPITFDTGNHHIYGTYGRANDWKGNIQGISVSSVTATTNAAQGSQVYNFGNDTGAKYWTIGYGYNLSQRTNVSVSYMQIKNDSLANYNGFANSFGTAAGNVGSDPRSFALGLRHTW